MRLKKCFLLFSLLSSCVLQAQDTLQVSGEPQKFTKKQSPTIENNVIDTVVHKQDFFKKEIKSLGQLDSIVEYQDLERASEIDDKWLEELYNNSLFDTIYRTVSELDYKTVYYPELPTDTLKARLAELNARTPFNVEYNPALESVIKSFLKNRRRSFEK